MEILIDFPGNSRVDAHFSGFDVVTDQPPEASAPSPFELFLVSIGTCTGFYVLEFCRQRSLPTKDIHVVQRIHWDQTTDMCDLIDLEIQVPPDFPEKYRDALVRSAKLCTVKQHLEKPPKLEIATVVVGKADQSQ